MPSKKASNKPFKNEEAVAKPRRLKQSPYKSFRLQKPIKHPAGRVPNSFIIFKKCLKHLFKYWKLFLGITLVYALLTLILVKGFGLSTALADIKSSLEALFQGKTNNLTTGFTLFTFLLGSAGGTTSPQASVYQTFLIVVVSLVIIWSLRHTYTGTKVSVKEAYYKGLAPLIPFVLVLFVIGLELIPMIIGNFLYAVAVNNSIAVTLLEKSLWVLLMFFLALLSLYMITSTIFALYIVTLPDLTPMQALWSARELVRYRRWSILRKILFLPLLLVILAALIVVPIILVATPIAAWIFFALTMLSLPLIHSYMYSLYRELL